MNGALEYVKKGIHVNAVNPGLIDTQIALLSAEMNRLTQISPVVFQSDVPDDLKKSP